uniref:Pre-mRNA cleavage complex 2 protein Pcf11 n=1 Tax=Rhipicephalus appendiculatus TaxID=34631 RepID=A0A131Z062_RHIAP
MQPPMQQPLQQPPTQPPALQSAVQQPPLQPPAMPQMPAATLPSPFPAVQADEHMHQQPSQAPTAAPAPPAALDVNVGELFSKLVAAGILKQSTGNGNAAGSQSAEQYQSMGGHLQKKKRRRPRGEHTRQEPKKPIEGIPLLSFSRTDQLKIKHPSVINALHVGTQCASCGLRFTDEKCEKYRQHLDWHFRANRRDKDGARKAFSRKWFYEVEDWIQFEEIEDLEERARSFFEQQATVEQDQSSNSPTAVKSVPASGDETGNTCAVCEEAFQLFWAEEEEQWHFKDAIRIENKVYHPACYEDFKRVNFCFLLLELALLSLQYISDNVKVSSKLSKQLYSSQPTCASIPAAVESGRMKSLVAVPHLLSHFYLCFSFIAFLKLAIIFLQAENAVASNEANKKMPWLMSTAESLLAGSAKARMRRDQLAFEHLLVHSKPRNWQGSLAVPCSLGYFYLFLFLHICIHASSNAKTVINVISATFFHHLSV